MMFLVLGMRPPCKGKSALMHQQEEHITEVSDCTSHSCCQSSSSDDSSDQEEGSCANGCLCFCCNVVIAPTFVDIYQSIPSLKVDETKEWRTNIYSHDFAYLIWHPPKIG